MNKNIYFNTNFVLQIDFSDTITCNFLCLYRQVCVLPVKNTSKKIIDATLYVIFIMQITNSSLKPFYIKKRINTSCMFILRAIVNGLACDCHSGVCMVLIMADHCLANILYHKNELYYTVLYIWYAAFIESYYFLSKYASIYT